MQYRQGDLLFERIETIPAEAVANPDRGGMVREGETTGHMHMLNGQDVLLYEAPATVRQLTGNELVADLFAAVPFGAELTHDEHGAIPIPAGNYAVTQQREYTGVEEVAWRPVVD